MTARMEIGENRAPRFGVPTWAGEWPVLINGIERSQIVETRDGYRLREGGRWINPERGCRSQVEDDVRNHCFAWITQNSHPFTLTNYQETEINGQTWARVRVKGSVTFGPDVRVDRVYAEFNRLYHESIREIDA